MWIYIHKYLPINAKDLCGFIYINIPINVKEIDKER